MSSRYRRRKPSGIYIKKPFAIMPCDLLVSPAWRVLSKSAFLLLSRINVELMNHNGKDNNSLPVTFSDFEEYGIDRHSIAPAIRLVTALGLARFTPGRAGNAEFRRAGKFGLTYQRCYDQSTGEWQVPTDEWRLIKSVEEASELVKKTAAKKQKASVGKRTVQGGKTHTENGRFQGGKTHTTAKVEKPTPLYISSPTPGERIPRAAVGGDDVRLQSKPRSRFR
jgi:hypothetical protein